MKREQARLEIEGLWRAYLGAVPAGRRPNMAAFFDRLRQQRPELMRAKGSSADWREVQGWLRPLAGEGGAAG
jgi:hypothetical protein